jgi:outer membrane protein assembly factor BamB
MNANPYLKPLKAFDPVKNLSINESFSSGRVESGSDTLSDLQSRESTVTNDSGQEFCQIKTGGPIVSGIEIVNNGDSGPALLVGNKSGEIYILRPTEQTFTVLSRMKIQGSIINTPSYQNGIIYCTTQEGIAYAIKTDISSSSKEVKPKILWQKKFNKGILTEPLTTGKLLIIATLRGLFCFEAYYQDESNKSIGKLLWKYELEGIVSTPRIDSGIIFIASEDKQINAFDYGGNKISKLWSYKLSDAARTKACVSSMKNLVLVPTIDGFIYALDRTSGEFRWNFVVRSRILSPIVSAVQGNDEYFYFGADNGKFYCINAMGKQVWSFQGRGKIRSEALVDQDRVYFGSEDNMLYALNRTTGSPVFTFKTDGNINGRPLVIDRVIYFGSSDSFVHGVHL